MYSRIAFALITLLVIAGTPTVSRADDVDDVDADGILDVDDACIGEHQVDHRGSRGTASLIFYHFDDSWLVNQLQDVVNNVSRATEGYDRVALLSNAENVAIERQADIFRSPTEENFFETLRELVRDGFLVDIWIFSHGSSGGWETGICDDQEDTSDDACNIDTNDLADLAWNVNGCAGSLPIRMVYLMACYGGPRASTFFELGARVATGSRFVNFMPQQYGRFAREWNDGTSVADALSASNTALTRTETHTLFQTALIADFVGIPSEFIDLQQAPSCRRAPNLLGNTDCSEEVFTVASQHGTLGDDFDTSQTGIENMNFSSEMLVFGDEATTRKTTSLDLRPRSDLSVTVEPDSLTSPGTTSLLFQPMLPRTLTVIASVADASIAAEPSSYEITLAIDGRVVASVIGEGLAPHELTFDVACDGRGRPLGRSLTATVRALDAVELDPNNDTTTLDLRAIFTPDVSIWSVVEQADGTVDVLFKSEVVGAVSPLTRPVVARATLQGRVVDEWTIASGTMVEIHTLAISAEELGRALFSAGPGGFTFVVEADVTDVYAEMDESNNVWLRSTSGALDLRAAMSALSRRVRSTLPSPEVQAVVLESVFSAYQRHRYDARVIDFFGLVRLASDDTGPVLEDLFMELDVLARNGAGQATLTHRATNWLLGQTPIMSVEEQELSRMFETDMLARFKP